MPLKSKLANLSRGTTYKTRCKMEDIVKKLEEKGVKPTAMRLLTYKHLSKMEVAISLGNVAAGISALKARQAVAYSASANLAAAAARIEDTDFAKETANLAKYSVLNQSAMAMVAQANQAQSAILAVLQ